MRPQMPPPAAPASPPQIDLRAPDLFGNDAAEDEAEDVFRAYAIDRDEVASFSDESRRLCVARAFKGEGKSALLRLAVARILKQKPDSLVVRETASALAPDVSTADFGTWVREWKKALLTRVASEVGQRIGMAWSDDSMALVEEAERQGFKSRSVVSLYSHLFHACLSLQRFSRSPSDRSL